MNTRKAICSLVVVLALLFTVVPVFGQSGYYEGVRDGERDGTNDAEIFGLVWGVLFGIINVGYVMFTPPPDIPGSRIAVLQDRSLEYKTGYIEGYRNARQSRRLLYSGAGLGVWLLIFYTLLAG